MADSSSAQLELYRANASSYQAQLSSAQSKNEALTLAIKVAENLMKAMNVATTASEKSALKAQCKTIMDVADRIKSSAAWTPMAIPPAGLQAPATVAGSAGPPPLETPPTEAMSSASSHDQFFTPISSTAHPSMPSVSLRTVSSAGQSASIQSGAPQILGVRTAGDEDFDLYDLSHTPSTSTSAAKTSTGSSINPSNVPTATGVETAFENLLITPPDRKIEATTMPKTSLSSLVGGSTPSPQPTMAPASRIRRLKQPISTRQRTRKEDILLLKASIINGFKFPPWDKNPLAAEFVPDQASEPFTDIRDLNLSTYQQQFFEGWRRATEAVPPPSMLSGIQTETGPTMHTSKPIDLVQDAATDCSVVASLCSAIARTERGHEQMLTNIIWPYDKNLGKPLLSPNGKYVVRLHFNGCWRKVVIDDRLPISSTSRLLHVTDRCNPSLLWPALLEKAYLKVRGGYDFPGSNSCSDLWTLTGWIPEEVYLQESDTVPGHLWKRIYNAFLYGDVLVTLGTGKMSRRQEKELGLEGQHSYSVLDMKEVDQDKWLLVKNPWVEGKGWKGPRPNATSDELRDGTELSTTDSFVEQPHATTFWISLDHVIQHFERLYLNWNPGLFDFRQDIHFEWAVDSTASANACIIKHPQFSFSCKDGGTVWLLLSRHFRDSVEDTKDESDAFNDGSIRPETHMYSSGDPLKGYMSITLCSGDGEQLYIKESYLESSPFVNTPQCLLRCETGPGEKYTIVTDQDELPPSKYTFSLSAFAKSAITLERASSRFGFQKVEQSAWTKRTAGGSTGSPAYFDNPQYTLEVKQKCSLAILLTSTKHSNPLHVKLVIGHGKRIYRLQSRDVLADSGDHRAECAFTSYEELLPGHYNIVCSLFEAGKTGDYTLQVDSTIEVGLVAIPRDGAGLLSERLTPACFASHVHKIAAPILPRRLASYTIVARFLRAASPRSPDVGHLRRSPMRLSIEFGRGPARSFLMTSEDGDYSDTAVVRSEKVTLDPADMHRGDLWLVLDRLSSTGGAIEEWYEVEVLTDVPQACSVGVWRNWDD